MACSQPATVEIADIAEFLFAEVGVQLVPQVIVAVDAVDLVGKAVGELNHKPLPRAETFPVKVPVEGILVKRLGDFIVAKAGVIAPHAQAVTDRAAHDGG